MLCNSSPETREHEKRRPVYQAPALKLRDQYIAMTAAHKGGRRYSDYPHPIEKRER